MKKSKVSSVVKYTVEKNIKNKWFIILNALFLIVAIVALNFNTVLNILKSNNIEIDKTKFNVILVDNENLIETNLISSINNSEYKDKFVFSKESTFEYDKDNFEDNKIIIFAESSTENILNVKIVSKEGIDTKYYDIIYSAIAKTKNDILKSQYNMSEEEFNSILEEPNIERIMTNVESENADIRYILQTISNYMILLVLMIVLSKIANDISQEKISKSIEYVLTSISEKEYLISKVISINLTLLIQLIFAIAYFLIASSVNSILNLFVNTTNISLSSNFDTLSILGSIDFNTVMYVIVTLVFMVLTVFIQSAIQAAISSKTTNITEANNATILLVTINLIIYMITTFAINPLKEVNIIINILSFVPIISMYFIPALMLVSNISMIHIVVSILITVISIPFVFKYCAKIFKDGVLDYKGKKKQKVVEVENLEEKESNVIKRKEYSRYGYVIGMSVILFIVCQMVFAVILSPLMSSIGSITSLNSEELSTILNIIVFIISLVVPTLFIKMYIDRDSDKCHFFNLKGIDVKRAVIGVLISIPIVILIQIILGILLEALGLNYDIVDKANLYSGSTILSKILFFLQIAILPAIFEELYVRGAVLSFSRKYSDKFAILVSAILFSLIHLNISQSVFAFLMGLLLATLVVKTKSIIPSMIIHFLNNGYEALYLIFEDNVRFLNVLDIIFLALGVLGVIAIIYVAIKNKEKIIKIFSKKQNNLENTNKVHVKIKGNPVLYMFYDYSFIIAIVLVLVMMVLTQKMLTIL